jgi:hypothetical protein
VLLTRSPLVYPRRGLTARLACVKHAASVRPEPGSNSPTKSGSSKPTTKAADKKQTGIKPIQTIARHTVEFSKDTRTPSTTARQYPGLCFRPVARPWPGQLFQATWSCSRSQPPPGPIRPVGILRGHDLQGWPPVGLTLGRRRSVPVCRAARRGDLEEVTHGPPGPSNRGSFTPVRAGHGVAARAPARFRFPRRTTSQPPARRSASDGTHCSSGTFALLT